MLEMVPMWIHVVYEPIAPTDFDAAETAFLENVLGFVRVIDTVLDHIKTYLPETLALSSGI